MSSSFDLDPVERITAGATGEPGDRTFFIQARKADTLVTLHAEKEQVAALAATLDQFIDTLPEQEDDAPEGEAAEAPDLEEPLLPEWRAGAMSLEYDQDRDLVALTIEESLPEDAEAEPATARFVATREQLRALARNALEVVAAGRPRCQFCGFPLDPEGHTCPAMNGHREI